MKKQDTGSVRANFRFAITQHPCAGFQQSVARINNVFDLVTNVMDAAVGIAADKGGNGGLIPKRLHKFDLRVRLADEDHSHTMLGERHRRAASRAKPGFPLRGCRFQIRHRNRDMVDASDHAMPLGHTLQVAVIKAHDMNMNDRAKAEHAAGHTAKRLAGDFLDTAVVTAGIACHS